MSQRERVGEQRRIVAEEMLKNANGSTLELIADIMSIEREHSDRKSPSNARRQAIKDVIDRIARHGTDFEVEKGPE